MERVTETLISFATSYGIRIVGAILILLVGRIFANWARAGATRGLAKSKTDPAVAGFVGSLVYFLVLTVAALAALGKFGVETASLVAVLGAASFAVGFALQGSLANFAAGVMLLLFRPFRIGDYVEAGGVAGVVKEMHLFTTMIVTPDNIRIIVPNGKVFGDTIKNVTAEDTRRVDLLIGIAYGASIEKAITTIRDVVNSDERILGDPAPQIAVADLADSSVNLVVRPWCKTADYWDVKFDTTRRIKEALDAQGIEIPFPHVVVHQR
ncbi:mechanosensitive ion channel [Candidatus Fermentibacteria bacterium]|nr:mechanosensitive ion channel [Candidatus Fermentibacteria bacterium]